MSRRNVIVGQSGGPTAVINSSLAGVYETALKKGYSVVYGMLNGVQGLLDGRYVDLSTQFGTKLNIELLKHTPGAFLGCCRYKLPNVGENDALYEKLFQILDDLEIDVFIYIGGNDSMDTITKLSKYAKWKNKTQRFIGVPKTIDNDLALTDHCPGFGSAAKYLATATKEIICDATSMDNCVQSVTILEVMGRNAGWLTGATVLAKTEECEGPDLIYLPETEFDLEDFKNKIKEKLNKKMILVVAVSEGIKTSDGVYVSELGKRIDDVDPFGHKQLSGTGLFLSNYISKELGVKSRCVEFSILQRCSSTTVSKLDIDEAFMVGEAAIKAVDAGESGRMVIIKRLSNEPYRSTAEVTELSKIANKEKLVPLEWIDKENAYVTDEFIDYVKPLIQGNYESITVDGLPAHLALKI